MIAKRVTIPIANAKYYKDPEVAKWVSLLISFDKLGASD
jgi:hypothetical protein